MYIYKKFSRLYYSQRIYFYNYMLDFEARDDELSMSNNQSCSNHAISGNLENNREFELAPSANRKKEGIKRYQNGGIKRPRP